MSVFSSTSSAVIRCLDLSQHETTPPPTTAIPTTTTTTKSSRLTMDHPIIGLSVEQTSIDCIFCLSNLPFDSMPLTGEYEPVAQLVPCSHFMHDQCLQNWIEIANSCPICRINFNEVKVHHYISGSVINTYQVEDKVQRVADHGVDIPQELLSEQPDLIDLSNETIVLVDLTERTQRAWANAWAHLDADLQQQSFAEEENTDIEQQQRQQLMERRRAAAAVQTGTGRNAFDEQPAAWETPTTRPRTTFPHLPHEMSKEESDSWKMMELAEKIEKSRKKRCRSTSSDESLLERLGIDVEQGPSDGRKFKRPRTKRDSQLPPINTRNIYNGESSRSGESVVVGTPTGNASDAGSPPSGGIFTSILAGIGRTQDIPIVSAADVSGRDLTKMRPISPDRSSIASAMSRSCSPQATFSPCSPPASQPTSPIGSDLNRGRRKLYSPSARTPAHSLEQFGRRPWEAGQPSSPPSSRAQSPNGRPNDIMRKRSITSPVGSSSGSSDESSEQQQHPHSQGITKQNKDDIEIMVSTALKPYYPTKLSRETYKEINKKISRRMYRLACDQGFLDTNKELWIQTIKDEVNREVDCL